LTFQFTSDGGVTEPGWEAQITCAPPPTCFPPTDLLVSGVTQTTASVSWTENNTPAATAWDYELVNITLGGSATGTPTANTGSNPLNLMSLTAETDYEIYIRANCGGGDGDSTWVGPFAFTTACATLSLPWNEDFENAGAIPSCWSMSGGEDWEFNTSGPNHVGNGGTITGTTPSGNYYAVIDDSDDDPPSTLTSPFVDISSLTTPMLSFYEISDNEGFSNATLDVEVWDGAAWNNVGTYNTNTSGWEEKQIVLSALTFTGPARVQFTITDSGSFYDDIAIDDVTFVEAPTCLMPSSLTATPTSATDATLTWTDNNGVPPSLGWQIEIVDVTGGPVAPTGTPTASIPLLSGATYSDTFVTNNVYEYYVRANCAFGDQSTWEGPFSWTQVELPNCISNPGPADMATGILPGVVTLSWDEPVTGGTVDSYDVYFGDTSGSLNLLGNIPAPATSQAISGIDPNQTYYWQIIAKNAGGDAIGCDEYEFTSGTLNGDCAGFTSTPGAPIPDADTANPLLDVISVSSTPGEVITDINVYVNITHTWVNDLQLKLITPNGEEIDLLTNQCGNIDDLEVLFDDEGLAFGCTVGTLSGHFTPETPLSDLDGDFFYGDWTLSVADSGGGDTGTLVEWCIIPTLEQAVSTTAAPLCTGITTTWDGSTWSNGAPTAIDVAVIDGLLNLTTAPANSFVACSLWITGSGDLQINDGTFADIEGSIINFGNISVSNEGSLVQVDDDTRAINIGSMSVNKVTPVLVSGDDFSILSSPMTGETREDVYAANSLVYNHNTLLFAPHPDVALLLPAADNWADDNGDNWAYHTGDLVPGTGYLVNNVGPGSPNNHTYDTGTFNNGPITFNSLFNTDVNDSPNILGNPYPSPIVVADFLAANPSIASVHYWEHLTPESPVYPGYNAENYDMGDISMRSILAGTPAANGGLTPGTNIPSGQGFGVKVGVAGPIVFSNSMRTVGPNNGYRSPEDAEDIDRLMLSVRDQSYNQGSYVAVAFSEIATDGYDYQMDSKRLATSVSLYTVNDGRQLGIEGRSAFNDEHIVPLGFSTLIEEYVTYTITMESIEGLQLSNATVYLKDNELNTVTNLSETNYSFGANVGEQNERFTLFFSEEVLDNGSFNLNSVSVYPNPTNGILTIVVPGDIQIESATIYDIRGREVARNSFDNETNYSLDLTSLDSAVYFVTIETNSGSVTKRIIRE